MNQPRHPFWTVRHRTPGIRQPHDFRRGAPKPPGYDRLNPHGQVPTLTVGEAVVSEGPAICIFLADRYGYGTLAPRIEEAARGAYLKWLVYATAVLEPARGTQGMAPLQFEPRWGVGCGFMCRMGS